MVPLPQMVAKAPPAAPLPAAPLAAVAVEAPPAEEGEEALDEPLPAALAAEGEEALDEASPGEPLRPARLLLRETGTSME